MDRAGSRLELAGDHTNERGLAGAVGAEQNAQLIFLDAEIQVIDDGEARHARGEAFDFEKVGHRACVLISSRAVAPVASAPIPKFVSLCGTLVCELRNRKVTSKLQF